MLWRREFHADIEGHPIPKGKRAASAKNGSLGESTRYGDDWDMMKFMTCFAAILLLSGFALAWEIEGPRPSTQSQPMNAPDPSSALPAWASPSPPTTSADDSDDSTGPLLIIFVMLVFILLASAVALVVAAVLGLLLLLLLILGIVSASVSIGIAKRSMGAAFRACLAMCAGVMMAILAPMVSSAALLLIGRNVPGWTVPVAAITGAVAGGFLGYFVAVLIGLMLTGIVNGVRRWTHPTSPVRRAFPVASTREIVDEDRPDDHH